MEKSEPNNRSLRKIITILVIVGLVIILPLVYFFAWRPSDADYQSAKTHLDDIQGTAKTAAVELLSIPNPGVINQTTAIKLEILSGVYKKSYTELVNNPVINRDFSVKSTYNAHREVLDEYNQSLINLTKSTQLYVAVLDKCKEVTDSLVMGYNEDHFNNLLGKCQKSISDGSSSKYQPFNDLFFNQYLELTATYMDTVEKMTKATTNAETNQAVKDLDTLYEKISNLGKVEMQFNLPDVSTAYKELDAVIDSQKSAFLR